MELCTGLARQPGLELRILNLYFFQNRQLNFIDHPTAAVQYHSIFDPMYGRTDWINNIIFD
jgi:hypothetical protein